jgi:hypothetical protein
LDGNLQPRRAAARQTLDELLVPRLVCWQKQFTVPDRPATVEGWGWAEGDEVAAGDWWRCHDPSLSFSHTYRRPDGAEAAVFTVRFPDDSQRVRRFEVPAAFVLDHQHDPGGDAA